MTYLPDVNGWIALAAEKHTHHRVARHWFTNLRDEKLAFCRLTQLGFLRLLTNKHVMQDEVIESRPGLASIVVGGQGDPMAVFEAESRR